MIFSRLFSICLFGHGDLIRERDADGKLELMCANCGKRQPLLSSEVITGPRATPLVVKGQPLIRAKRKNVAEFPSERMSQR